MTSPFNVISENHATEVRLEQEFSTVQNKIEHLLSSNPIILFMKGNSDTPKCGFSANTVSVLNTFGHNFATFDILNDVEIRQGLKEYSNWPTYPQLYVKGELIGGADIITELLHRGELKDILSKAL